MQRTAWHPRLIPIAIYLVLVFLIDQVRPLAPMAYPAMYVAQCSIVLWLLWRYRKLLPELTLRFHWLAVPTAIGLTIAWIGLGWMMAGEFAMRWDAIIQGQPLGQIDYATVNISPGRFATTGTHYFQQMQSQPWLYWLSIGLRLIGMSLVVPLFEELFIRSLCLRTLHRAKETGIGILQVLHDMPMIGDWFMHTQRGRRVAAMPSMFSKQYHQTPLGAITVFGIFASTTVFTFNHIFRDWPGAIACGVVWCLLVWYTNRPGGPDNKKLGLGPVIWSHALCNALLWGYSIYTGDWQFL